LTGVTVDIKIDNFEQVHGKLKRFPKAIDGAVRRSLSSYYHRDFKPMLGAILKGRRAANVPARNSPRWASIKAARYGISHSLGILSGSLHAGAMSVRPYIDTRNNRTLLTADFSDVPHVEYPYLQVIEFGLDGLHQAYPVVEAARLMTHDKMMKRVDQEVSQAWDKLGG
jgi:hypothetical protein